MRYQRAIAALIIFLSYRVASPYKALADENTAITGLPRAAISALADAARTYRETNLATALELDLLTVDGTVSLRLEPHDIRSPDYTALLSTEHGSIKDNLAAETELFTGTVNDNTQDFARLALLPTNSGQLILQGLFKFDNTYYEITPFQNSPTEIVVSKLSEDEIRALIAECGTIAPSYSVDELLDRPPQILANQQAQIATEADYEYYQILGSTSSANANILSIINSIDAIYQSQVNVTFSVTFQNVWATSFDPYSTSNSSGLLNEFREYWEENYSSSQTYDLAHLWTGRDLDSSVVGVAFLGVICSSASYGLSQYLASSAYSVPLAAHEIGHNFSSVHDSCPGSEQYLMCPALNANSSTFSSASISSINSHVNSVSCLSTVDDPGGDGNAPVLSPIGAQNVNEGSLLTITLSATDVDGDALTYSVNTLPDSSSLSANVFTYTPAFGTVGDGNPSAAVTVIFTVTDATGLSDSESVIITVTNSNRAPVLTSPSAQSVSEGDLVSTTLSASDPDGDSLTYSITSTLPAGATFDSSTGAFTWRPAGNQSGVYALSLRVVDVYGASDTGSMQITVNDDSTVAPLPTSLVSGNFDGSDETQASVFRQSTGYWYWGDVSESDLNSQQFGLIGDIPVPGDYNGDNISDIAVFRPSNSTWYILNSGTATLSASAFGLSDDLPMPGDFDGDGRFDIAVFRPTLGVVIYRRSSDGTDVVVSMGDSGDIPAVCDYDGDGIDDIALFHADIGDWTIDYSGSNPNTTINWGIARDIPVPADYDGDNDCELAIFRPSTGEWYINGGEAAFQYGLGSYVPVPGDYDGDGTTEAAYWDPSSGIFYVRQSSTLTDTRQLGLPTDVVSIRESLYYAFRHTGEDGTDGLSGGLANVDLYSRSQSLLYSMGFGTGTSLSLAANAGSYILRGNYDADSAEDLVVFENGVWTIYGGDTTVRVVWWGQTGDVPIAADFDGDEQDDIAVFRPDGGGGFSSWYIINSSTGAASVYSWGLPGDTPIAADFNGDAYADICVWRPSDGTWYVLDGRSGQALPATQWGLYGDIPLVGDFDADGRMDKLVWRGASGFWFLLYSGGGSGAIAWGLPGDIPVPATYLSNDSFDYAVYRPSNKELYILGQTGLQYVADASAIFGSSTASVVNRISASALD